MIIYRAFLLPLGGFLLALASCSVQAESLSLPQPGSDLVGKISYAKALKGDTLIDVAHRNSVGQDEIVQANPTESRYYWVPGEGTKVRIPHQFILPDAPRVGIVVNIPEMRLYYFPPGENKEPPTEVYTYPISIGRMDWKSPLGVTKIVEKIKDPTWTPPESIKREHALDGEILPDVVPAGPDNPLGQFAMRLGVKGSYLIHGTGQNKADGIGMMVTHGCMRMYPEDVAKLYPKVSVGTQVNLINQPVKVGWQGDTLFIEVSQPLDEDNLSYSQLLTQANALIQKKTADRAGFVVNREALKLALEKSDGIPTAISGQSAVTRQAASPESHPASTQPSQAPTTPSLGQTPPVKSAPDSGQPIRQPNQVAIPAYPTRPAAPIASSGQTYQIPQEVRKPAQATPVDVPPGPTVTPSKGKSEQQLLPPIY